jgi:glycosyltransferase involved in cell wall biosynthesis
MPEVLKKIAENRKKEQINELSVILPVYNGERTLEQCLYSIFHQEYYPKKFEVVVVNDGSTDRSRLIANKFPVTLVNLPYNQGRITARNVGVKNTKYKYLLFIDADCIPTDQWIFQTVKYDYEPLQGQVVNTIKKPVDRFFYLARRRYYKRIVKPVFITEQNFFRFPKGLGNFLVSKKLYKKINFKNIGELFSDDQYFIYELGKYKKVLSIPETIVHANERPTFKALLIQWFQRGCRFSDFYLKKEGILEKKFNLILLILFSITVFITYLIVVHDISIIEIMIASIILGFLSFILYLSENPYDFFIVGYYAVPVSVMFIAGILYKRFLCRELK